MIQGHSLRRGPQHSAIRDLPAGQDADVDFERLEAWRDDLDLVFAVFERQRLEHAVEVVDVAREVSIDVHFRVTRLDLQAQFAELVPVAAACW